MYKDDLALNNLQWLIGLKTQPTKIINSNQKILGTVFVKERHVDSLKGQEKHTTIDSLEKKALLLTARAITNYLSKIHLIYWMTFI